jgi:hypothetical protein
MNSTDLRTDLSWNRRAQRLEGTLLGVQNAQSGRGTAYQGELLTGRVVTVYWDGTVDTGGNANLYNVDTREQYNGAPYAWRWYSRLGDVG